MGFVIIIGILILIFIILIKRKNKDKINKNLNTISIIGAPGMGKTYIGVELALKRLLINRKKTIKLNKRINFFNLFRKNKKDLKPLPQLYSNFKISYKNLNSIPLKKDHFLMQEKLIENSIIVADEFGTIASQFAYQDQELTTNISEFIRLLRHYVGEKALLIVIDQDIDRISLEVRRSLGAIYEIIDKKILWKLYRFKLVKYINFKQSTNNVIVSDRSFTISGLFKKPKYDSRYYSERYQILKETDYQINNNEKELKLLRLDQNYSNLDILIEKEVKKRLKNEKQKKEA